jgi:hypothetical protein
MELSLYDDNFYTNNIKELVIYLTKNKLINFIVEQIINDLKIYIEYHNQNSIIIPQEIRFGYILYSHLEFGTSKMNELLNYMLQYKYPDIYLRSNWETLSQVTGPTEVNGVMQTVTADKIRIKLIIKNNNKDLTIRKLVESKLISIKKKNKKMNEYLEDFTYEKKKENNKSL